MLISLLSAFIVLTLLLTLLYYTFDIGWIYRALMTGLITAITPLAVYTCVKMFSKLRKKVKINFPVLSASFTAILMVVLFVTGAVGQCLYSLQIETVAPQKDAKEADMVLLFDDSGSTNEDGYSSAARQACEKFIDRLDSSTRLSAIVFSTKIDNFIDLRKMDSTGKSNLKNALNVAGTGNGTNLVAAFTKAHDILTGGKDSTLKTVFVITDGSGVVPSDLANLFANDSITVQIIRPDKDAPFVTELAAFATTGGGSDNTVPLSGNSYNADDILNVMKELSTKLGIGYSESASTQITFADGLLLHDTKSSIVRFLNVLIRFLVFIVISLLTQYFYFRKMDLSSVLFCLLNSAIACALVTIGGAVSLGIVTILGLSLFIYTIFVRLQRT